MSVAPSRARVNYQHNTKCHKTHICRHKFQLNQIWNAERFRYNVSSNEQLTASMFYQRLLKEVSYIDVL